MITIKQATQKMLRTAHLPRPFIAVEQRRQDIRHKRHIRFDGGFVGSHCRVVRAVFRVQAAGQHVGTHALRLARERLGEIIARLASRAVLA